MNIDAQWDSKNKILTASISGIVNIHNVKKWEIKINNEFSKMKKNEKFFFLFDSSNYNFDNIKTHKYFREIIPKILIMYNYRLSYINETDMRKIDKPGKIKSQICIGAAIVHHDIEKMKKLDKNYGSKKEKYFFNIDKAKKWIKKIKNEEPASYS